MHDKVSVVDRFSFWFSSRNSFQGAKSIVMQTSIVFEPNFRGQGAEVSEGTPFVEGSQASDSVMRLSNSVNNGFSSKMRISHHYLQIIVSKNNRAQTNLRLAFDNP